MNANYAITRLPERGFAPDLSGKPFDPQTPPDAFCALPEARIALYPWAAADDYRPDARARVGWNEMGLSVLMYAKEATIQATETRVGGRQCADSCLEFFFTPFPETDARYINIEFNPLAVPHIGVGAGRRDRKVLTEIPKDMNPTASRHAGEWWAVAYTVPMAFIHALFGQSLAPGQTMRGNFYTCDESVHPHFGTWHPVNSQKPDFHRPEDFGILTLL